MTDRRAQAHRMVGYVLDRRSDGAFVSELRRSRSRQLQPYAMRHVGMFIHDDREVELMLALASTVATYRDIKNIEREPGKRGEPLGASLRRMADLMHGPGRPRTPKDWEKDPVARRLARAPEQDALRALDTVDSIFDIAQSKLRAPSVDWLSFMDTFLFWGRGITRRSKDSRMRLLTAFYATPNRQPDNDTTIKEAA